MIGNENIRVGSKLIEGGRVYKIFKIEEEIIYYKPYFSKKADTSMICSIPKHNLSSTLIREPLSKKDIQIFLKGLAIGGFIVACFALPGLAQVATLFKPKGAYDRHRVGQAACCGRWSWLTSAD